MRLTVPTITSLIILCQNIFSAKFNIFLEKATNINLHLSKLNKSMEWYVEDGKGRVIAYDPATEGNYYYVLRTPRNKALRVKKFCQENNIDAIVPVHYQNVVYRGKVSRELVSALDNLIYVKADLERLRWIKKHLPYLTYVKTKKSDGSWKKHQVFIESEIVELFNLLESNYLADFLIINSEDVSNDDFMQIDIDHGIFKDIPLFFENVKSIDHKCLTMILDYGTVIAVTSLTPESFMSQECVMSQIINGKSIKTQFPINYVAR